MGLPAPKIRDLAEWTIGTSAQKQRSPNEVWEIGVPKKNSLLWSVVMSHLYSTSGSELTNILQKLTGNEEEVKEIQRKKKMEEKRINVNTIKKELQSFNPFKNRHASFHNAKEITEVIRIFDERLRRFASKRRKKTDDWNDDFKLNSASLFLECVIEIYFPDEINSQKVVTYPKIPHDFKTKIVLFQYENCKHGSKKEPINVFHFTMTTEEAHSRKLDALAHFLKKAKLNNEDFNRVKQLMGNPKVDGRCFLPTILKNECCDFLPKLYRSPYIAIKLSEAGFETNPIERFKEDLSALGHAALFCKNTKCLRILYDCALNCGLSSNESQRQEDEVGLEALKQMEAVLENDRTIILSEKFPYDRYSPERALYILEQYASFREYQTSAISNLITLKECFTATENVEMQFPKQVIESILENYLEYFYHSKNELKTIQDQLIDYVNFSEYYEIVDNFAWISFFDNFYRLRLCIGLKEENVFLNIEWRIFIAMKSNIYFPMLNHETKYDSVLDKIRCQKDNVLRYIPLYHRNILHKEIADFLDKIKKDSYLMSLGESLNKRGLEENSDALPQITDEILITRLKLHIEAALNVSPVEDGIKAILVIERALIIIGESIKAPSSNGEVVSYLLRSRLPINLEKDLIKIRNDISKYIDNSVNGRLNIEGDFEYFNSIKEELNKIKDLFEVVYYTQSLRTVESVMINCLKEIGMDLHQDVRKIFYDEYSRITEKREVEYKSYHSSCLQLLFDSLWYLKERDINIEMQVMGQIKAINYLLVFMYRHTRDNFFSNILSEFTALVKNCENETLDYLKREVHHLVLKILNQYNTEELKGKSLSAPNLQKFFTSLKKNLFSDDEKDQIKKAIHLAYVEAIDAYKNLEEICTQEMHKSTDELEEYLRKIFIPVNKKNYIKNYFDAGDMKQALKSLKKCYAQELLERDLESVLEKNSAVSGYFRTLLIKITYQQSKYYPSATLSENTRNKLDFFLMKKVQMLRARLKAVKSILIEEDQEIKETWTWGRSEVIKHHNKFVMRQRYIRDITVRASLDMAFLDCMGILEKDCFNEFYEKSTDLFSGINLRNIMAHRSNIPETIGGILDEKDFPSTIIKKLLMLIEDTEAIECMVELFPKSHCLFKEDFVSWISDTSENYQKEKTAIKDCPRWKNYLFLLPLISN